MIHKCTKRNPYMEHTFRPYEKDERKQNEKKTTFYATNFEK